MSFSSKYDLLVITGPTASGKTGVAAEMAMLTGGELISADSRQVYRGMDIGTGKDLNDFVINGKAVPYHLIDVADPGYKYNLFEYQRDFARVYHDMKNRQVFPVVCGGSGLYVDSIVSGYRLPEVPADLQLRSDLEKMSLPELISILSGYKNLHNQTDTDNKKRAIRAIEIEEYKLSHKIESSGIPELKSLVTGILPERETRRRRISRRLRQRLEEGMVDEVRHLLEKGLASEDLIYYGLEYKYITLYLIGKLSYNSMLTELETAIHQFAKRQMTWFRGMERRGVEIHWIDSELPLAEKTGIILDMLKK